MTAFAWFHQSGVETILHRHTDGYLVELHGPRRRCTIQPISDIGGLRFEVEWQIQHALGEHTDGRRMWTEPVLRAAFDIAPHSFTMSEGDRRYSERWDLEIAKQGVFLRAGAYLTFPCPCTAHCGDPNFSVVLTDDIRSAVRTLVQ